MIGSVHEFRQVPLVGRKIRELRKERKLTQTELSARIGIQQSDLSRMEQGEYRVSLDTLLRILSEFKVGIGEFFEEAAKENLAPFDVHLVHELRSLPPHDQREIEELILERRSRVRGGGGIVANHRRG
jgi:transcriptional regulator with XRE-family HTH domain